MPDFDLVVKLYEHSHCLLHAVVASHAFMHSSDSPGVSPQSTFLLAFG